MDTLAEDTLAEDTLAVVHILEAVHHIVEEIIQEVTLVLQFLVQLYQA